jgi:hypothetical protein
VVENPAAALRCCSVVGIPAIVLLFTRCDWRFAHSRAPSASNRRVSRSRVGGVFGTKPGRNPRFVVVRPIAVRDRSYLARWISGWFGVVLLGGVQAANRRLAGRGIRVFTRTAERNSHRGRLRAYEPR